MAFGENKLFLKTRDFKHKQPQTVCKLSDLDAKLSALIFLGIQNPEYHLASKQTQIFKKKYI